MLNHGVILNLHSAKVTSFAIFETYISSHKDEWIVSTDFV